MPPKPRKAIIPAATQTYDVQPRCVQTSGIFRLPAELIVETLAYFGDPHHNVIFAKKTRGAHSILDPDDVERLTVIRILTMTCWHLRNMLFPLLWKYVEGCNVSYRHMQQRSEWGGNGLYAQCTYLVLNPTISAYVQTLSVDLQFRNAPKDLMTKFVNCLVRLPNLRTLEVFNTSHTGPINKGLKRKCARFTGVRELRISNKTAKFIGSCPNVESIITPDGFSWGASTQTLFSHARELGKLKRLVGVDMFYVGQVVQGCPDLQEIGIRGEIGIRNKPVTEVEVSRIVGHLRSLKRLAVVELDFPELLVFVDIVNEAKVELCRTEAKPELRVWKRYLIQVLKDSPSRERKFLRWKATEYQIRRGVTGQDVVVREIGELEIPPET